MIRYALLALTLLLAVDDFTRGTYAGQTVTGHALASLAYALTPALIAVVVAGATHVIRQWRGRPDIFAKDFTLLWAIFFCVLVLGHVRAAIVG